MGVSVALCTFNGEKYLEAQLGSLADQTRKPSEIVVCDDCSSDRTLDILTDFVASVHFPVKVFRNESVLGSTRNFEKAISLCGGDLIALCDQDDIWEPEKLEKLSCILEQSPDLGGVFSDAALIDGESARLPKRFWETLHFSTREQDEFHRREGRRVLLRRNVVAGTTLVFRSDLRSMILPIPSHWVHDGWIAWMLALYSRLDALPEPLVRYRIHAGQQCGISPLSLSERIRSWRKRAHTHYQEVEAQFRTLRDYVASHTAPSSDSFLADLDGKIDHCRFAAALSSHLLVRILQMCCGLPSYRKYTVAAVSVCKDLLR